MKIATINVNGIREAVGRGFLDWLANQDADVVCVQNIKAKSFELDDSILYPEGYDMLLPRRRTDGFSGVGLYCRKIPKAIMYGLGFPSATMKDASQADRSLLDRQLPDARRQRS